MLFHCFAMLQVCENEISLRNSSSGPEYLSPLEGTLLTMQCKWTFTKHFILSTLQKMPHFTVTITKERFVGSNSQVYIVLRQFTQYAICRFSTKGISFQLSIAMNCKERSIGMSWFSTKPQIMTFFT